MLASKRNCVNEKTGNDESWLEDVRANCFCASLLRTYIPNKPITGSWYTGMRFLKQCLQALLSATSLVLIEQMVIAIALPGFKDLGRSADNISLQRSNCNIFWLADTLHSLYSLMKPFSDLGCSSWHVVVVVFFTIYSEKQVGRRCCSKWDASNTEWKFSRGCVRSIFTTFSRRIGSETIQAKRPGTHKN